MESAHAHGDVHGKAQGAATKDYPHYLNTTTQSEERVYLRVNLTLLRNALRGNSHWADTAFQRDDETFKAWKYDGAMATILEGAPIYTPWLGSEHGRVRIVDGRHRLYALIDLGYSHVRIVTDPWHAPVLGALVDPVDSAKDHNAQP